jgi:hypothetical protein
VRKEGEILKNVAKNFDAHRNTGITLPFLLLLGRVLE